MNARLDRLALRLRRARLRRRLRRAARLYQRKKISELDYAVIAMDSVERFKTGEPWRGKHHLQGKKFDWVEWPIAARTALVDEDAQLYADDSIEDRYGPFEHATFAVLNAFKNHEALDALEPWGFRWGALQDRALSDAYQYFYRRQSVERWIGHIRANYPNTLLTLGWALSIAVSLVAGAKCFN